MCTSGFTVSDRGWRIATVVSWSIKGNKTIPCRSEVEANESGYITKEKEDRARCYIALLIRPSRNGQIPKHWKQIEQQQQRRRKRRRRRWKKEDLSCHCLGRLEWEVTWPHVVGERESESRPLSASYWLQKKFSLSLCSYSFPFHGSFDDKSETVSSPSQPAYKTQLVIKDERSLHTSLSSVLHPNSLSLFSFQPEELNITFLLLESLSPFIRDLLSANSNHVIWSNLSDGSFWLVFRSSVGAGKAAAFHNQSEWNRPRVT